MSLSKYSWILCFFLTLFSMYFADLLRVPAYFYVFGFDEREFCSKYIGKTKRLNLSGPDTVFYSFSNSIRFNRVDQLDDVGSFLESFPANSGEQMCIKYYETTTRIVYQIILDGEPVFNEGNTKGQLSESLLIKFLLFVFACIASITFFTFIVRNK